MRNPSTGRSMALDRLCAALLAGAATATLATGIRAQQTPAASTPKTVAPKPPQATQSHEESDGERVFAANCSRCHTAPDGFSQHISGTVVRHMRMRASLSAEDEKALLRFFNPQ